MIIKCWIQRACVKLHPLLGSQIACVVGTKKRREGGKIAQWKRDSFSPQSLLLSPPHLRPVTQARSQRSCLTETSTVIPLKSRVFKNHFLTLLYENEGGNKIGSIEQVQGPQLGRFYSTALKAFDIFGLGTQIHEFFLW